MGVRAMRAVAAGGDARAAFIRCIRGAAGRSPEKAEGRIAGGFDLPETVGARLAAFDRTGINACGIVAACLDRAVVARISNDPIAKREIASEPWP